MQTEISTLVIGCQNGHLKAVADSEPGKTKHPWPWEAGIRAAKANFLPALVVQVCMLLLLIAYYKHTSTKEALDQLADFKTRSGYFFVSGTAMIAAAIIPELLRILFFQKGRLQRRNLTNLIFTLPFWGFMAITVDLFYRAQAAMFGNGIDFQTIAIKVVVDQFAYAAMFASPVTCVLYDWKHNRYSLKGMSRVFSQNYYRGTIFPVLFTNWCVWIPMICVIYCLPLPLQFPLFSLALSMWVLIYTWMSESHHKAP